MKKRKLLFTMLALSLGCFTGGNRAMAQNGWEAIYTQTQTTSDDWNPLASDQTGGYTLGATGTTKYYYLKKSLNFTNGTAGGSGLKIQGTVYLYLPAGITITCQGANASGTTGAGAGIELSSGNTLYIIGGGTGTAVNATGGNAANGSNGGTGGDASGSWGVYVTSGVGGTGGNGGGGAGAGIGTRGGNGGTGGAGGGSVTTYSSDWVNGTNGSSGTAGTTADGMGNLYVDQTFGITVTATGGSAATSGGSGGGRGRGRVDDDDDNYSVAGGGGGGGGGFGGAASNIGTGGPGGGGGGGGAGGQIKEKGSGWYDATAYGGNGGQNANGTYAGTGTEALTSGQTYQDGLVDTNENWSSSDFNSGGSGSAGTGGASGAKGNNASNGTQNTGKKEYKLEFSALKTNLSKDTRLTKNSSDNYEMNYSPSGATNVILPQNKDGYQWVLLTYGKSCAPNGTPDSQFAMATKNYFGGHVSEAERTIILSNVYGDLLFQEIATLCKIANSGNNDQDIAEFQEASYPITVRLKDRTLYRDNHWNTICLPFNLTAEQYNSVSCPLAGATIFKMDENTTGYYPNGVENSVMHINYTSPTLLFWFENANPSTNGLQAGKPYLVKWTEGNQFTTDGNYVDNTADGGSRHELDFSNVTITRSSPDNWTSHANTSGNVVFQGTFSSSATIYADDKTRLMLGADDKLYYPSKNINVSACRGYFIIPEAAVATSAPQMVMGFNDGETTSIQTINVTPNSQQDAPVYNLNGQRLSAPQKGINIVNGKKIIIK